jgi:hypothetical protein
MAELAIVDMPVNVNEDLVTPENNVLDLKVPLDYPITVRCTVRTGTISFSQAGVASLSTNPSLTVGENIEMTLLGNRQLNFIATAQDNDFDIEVIRQRGQ